MEGPSVTKTNQTTTRQNDDPSSALLDAREALLAARKGDDPAALAQALVDLSELEPAFRYRVAPARDLLLEAGPLLPPLHDLLLEGRCLLRLGELRMIEGLLDQAAQFAETAEARLGEAGAKEEMFCAACLRVRVLRRQGQKGPAEHLLADVATRAADFTGRNAGSRGLSAFTLAIAEGQLENDDPEAIRTLRTLLGALDRGRTPAPDARFAAHQGIALLAQVTGHLEQAVSHLRTVTQMVKEHDAPLDLLECRLALGTALSSAGKMDEARRVLQVVVDAARDLREEEHRLLGLTGLATVLSTQGAYKGAVDLALQGAVGYGQRGNLLGYVRSATLAAHILLSHGKDAAAVELLMIGVSSLRHTLGEDAAKHLDAQLDAIQAEMGEEKYEAVCNDILLARAARRRATEG